MVLLPAAAAVAGSSGFSPPLKARKRPQKNRGRGGGTGGRGGSTAPRLPVQVWDLLHGGEEEVASRIPEKVVADANQADAAAKDDVEDDCAASALILSPNNEERQVMAGIAKDHSPTDDVIYHSDAVKSAVMDSHAVVLDDCNRILMDRKAAAADVEVAAYCGRGHALKLVHMPLIASKPLDAQTLSPLFSFLDSLLCAYTGSAQVHSGRHRP